MATALALPAVPCPQVLVCTLAMLCSPALQRHVLRGRSMLRLLVDEASQIYVGDYLAALRSLGPTLRQGQCLCLGRGGWLARAPILFFAPRLDPSSLGLISSVHCRDATPLPLPCTHPHPSQERHLLWRRQAAAALWLRPHAHLLGL